MLAPRKIAIRQNIWDNWYGYVGGKKVIAFGNDPYGSQEQHAKEWKEEALKNEHLRPSYRYAAYTL